MASLKDYERKRTRGKTPEPFGEGTAATDGKAPIFVVQRHDARRLHYDFRLERDGALASWAVPKGVPLEPGHAAPRRPRRGPPARVRDLRGRDPGRELRRRHGRDLGSRHLRARRGEAERRPDRPSARRAARGARGRSCRRSSRGDPKNWLLVEEEGGGGARAGEAARLRADARDARRPTCRAGEGWLFEVKWDGYRAIATIRGGDVELRSRNDNVARPSASRPSSARSSGRVRTPDCVLDGEVVRRRRGRPRDVLGDAAGQGRHDVPLRRVRRARGRGRAAGRPAADRAAASGSRSSSTGASAASSSPTRSTTARRSTRPRRSSASRGSWPSAPTRATSRAGASRDWLKIKTHGRQELVIAGYTKGQGRRADAFGALVLGVSRGRRPPLGGQRRHRLRRRGDRRGCSSGCGRSARRPRRSPRCRRCRGCARATSSGSSRSSSPRCAFAEWTHDGRLRAPVVPGPARGQGGGGGAARASDDRAGAQEGQARPEALEPGQAVLAGGGDHEGRPARLLPRRRAGARAAPARPAVHDEALPGRLAGQVLLPEGRAEAHAGLDPDAAVRGLDARQAAAAAA